MGGGSVGMPVSLLFTKMRESDDKIIRTVASAYDEIIIKEKRDEELKERERELKEQAEIAEYRKKMKFPAYVEKTYNINSGSNGSSQSVYEEEATANKNNTYSRAGKRGTRLVRSV